MEQWKVVPGSESVYEVSDKGRLRRRSRGAILNGTKAKNGYIQVVLCINGKVTRSYMHRIVAAAWVGECPLGFQVDHINGVRDDNRSSNLRYVTPKENSLANVARDVHVRGSRHGGAKLTEEQVAEIRQQRASRGYFWGARELAEKFGVNQTQVTRAARGRTFKHVP